MAIEGYLLGIDVGSSSVKAAVVDIRTGGRVAFAQSPAQEMPILAPQSGWAEQHPDDWWFHVVTSVRMALEQIPGREHLVRAAGISYQMHGLVAVNKKGEPVRMSIIWCDSRAVSIGDKAFHELGESFCLEHYLNSPGNFTASKLRWVKEAEPVVYEGIHKFMLPGDYIAFRMTGEISTTDSGLSEGILWDFRKAAPATELMGHYGLESSLLPEVRPVFSIQGKLHAKAASELGLPQGMPVAYRAGDQPNNAFSLNVLNPGEAAATAGTSGVIYAVSDKNIADEQSRVNTFLHVTNKATAPRNGVLLCVNGCGILNSWLRKMSGHKGSTYTYNEMNQLASTVPTGSAGLIVMPFGNGAERVLENAYPLAKLTGLDFNKHGQAHLFRAAQEGIVFALNYGLQVLREMGCESTVIRAGHANMFLSPVFQEAFVNTTGARLELFATDGATGAALGAGVGAGVYGSLGEAFAGLKMIKTLEPEEVKREQYLGIYETWRKTLDQELENKNRN